MATILSEGCQFRSEEDEEDEDDEVDDEEEDDEVDDEDDDEDDEEEEEEDDEDDDDGSPKLTKFSYDELTDIVFSSPKQANNEFRKV